MKSRAATTIKIDTNALGKFAPITPGEYVARIETCEVGFYMGGWKGAPEKSYRFMKMRPKIVILNEQQTEISRQDITIGAVDDEGYLYRPDGDDSKPAVFALASHLIAAAGFVNDDNTLNLEAFDPRLLTGQLVRVNVVNTEYKAANNTMKLKNEVIGFGSLRDDDLTDDMVIVGRMIFLSEADADRFEAALAQIEEEALYSDDVL